VPEDRPLEEVIGAQALEVDQRAAVMACLCGESHAGGPFRNWSSASGVWVFAPQKQA
jgi:hypothetical protein